MTSIAEIRRRSRKLLLQAVIGAAAIVWATIVVAFGDDSSTPQHVPTQTQATVHTVPLPATDGKSGS